MLYKKYEFAIQKTSSCSHTTRGNEYFVTMSTYATKVSNCRL